MLRSCMIRRFYSQSRPHLRLTAFHLPGPGPAPSAWLLRSLFSAAVLELSLALLSSAYIPGLIVAMESGRIYSYDLPIERCDSPHSYFACPSIEGLSCDRVSLSFPCLIAHLNGDRDVFSGYRPSGYVLRSARLRSLGTGHRACHRPGVPGWHTYLKWSWITTANVAHCIGKLPPCLWRQMPISAQSPIGLTRPYLAKPHLQRPLPTSPGTLAERYI